VLHSVDAAGRADADPIDDSVAIDLAADERITVGFPKRRSIDPTELDVGRINGPARWTETHDSTLITEIVFEKRSVDPF
jgi:hypothetical protein